MIGARARHGPHQEAQKSTSTGSSDRRTSFSNVSSSTSVMFAPAIVSSFFVGVLRGMWILRKSRYIEDYCLSRCRVTQTASSYEQLKLRLMAYRQLRCAIGSPDKIPDAWQQLALKERSASPAAGSVGV